MIKNPETLKLGAVWEIFADHRIVTRNLGFLELKRPASIDQLENHASSKKYVLYRKYSQARASHVFFFARKNPISSCDDEA